MDKLAKPDVHLKPSAEVGQSAPSRPSVKAASERGAAARQIHRSLKAWRSEDEESASPEQQPQPEQQNEGQTADGQTTEGQPNGAQAADAEEPSHKKVSAKLKSLSRKIYREDTPPGGAAAAAPADKPKHPLIVRLLAAGFSEAEVEAAKADKALQLRMLGALDAGMGRDKLLEALGLPPEPAEAQVTNAIEVAQKIKDGAYEWTAKYTLESLDDSTLRVVIKVKLVKGAGVTDPDVERVKGEASAGVAQYWNNKFTLTDKADNNKVYPLTVKAEFVDSGEHLAVNLKSGAGPDNLGEWYCGGAGRGITRAHELGHQMGLKDEYVDNSGNAPSRATGGADVKTDNSIMGNYYTEGIGNVQTKERHAQALASVLNTATGSRMEGGLK